MLNPGKRRHRRKILLTSLFLLLSLLVLPACGSQTSQSPSTPKEQPKEIPVGVVLSLTGINSNFGIAMRSSIEIAAEEINQAGGINGAKIKLIIRDIESDPSKALLATKSLVEQGVVAIMGPENTPSAMAIVQYLEDNKVPFVPVVGSDRVTNPAEKRKYIFNITHYNSYQIKRLASFFKAQGITKIAFLQVNNAYGDDGLAEFKTGMKGTGVEIAAVEKFEAADTDVKPQLTRIKANKDVQAIAVWAIPPGVAIVTKNYHELGIDIPLIQSYGAGSAYYMQLAGQAAIEGSYIIVTRIWAPESLPADDPQKAIVEKYTKSFQAKTGQGTSANAAVAYDSLLVIAQALKQGKPTRESLRDELERVTGLVGVNGVYNLAPGNHNGASEKDLIVAKMVGGKWKKVNP